MKKIGFIGLGVMGNAMAQNLLRAGFNLFIYNRTKARGENLIELGAIWCDNPIEVAEKSDLTITIVGYPKDVREVYFGENGLLNVEKETTFIDMTTSEPALAKEIYLAGKEKGIKCLDAPVSGGDVGAKNGTLTIMVGGDEEDFNNCLPVLKVLGDNIAYVGQASFGQHTKMVNQIAISGSVIGMVEALAYASSMDLDVKKVIQTISSGAAGSWQLINMAPRIIDKDYDPGFFIKHFIKDMNIAQKELRKIGIDLPALNLVESIYESLAENGYENLGTQALYKYYDLEDK